MLAEQGYNTMTSQQFTLVQDGALSFTVRDGGDRPWWWYLDLHGKPLYFLSGSCNTCEAIFERVGTLDTPLTPSELSAALNAGLAAVTPEVIQTVAPLLPKGRYLVNLLSILPTRWDYHQPHPRISSAADYFWWRLFDQRGREIWYELILPCVAETVLNPTRISYYHSQILQGHQPTALAFSFDDSRALAGRSTQAALVHFLLDGHHKVMAASQLGQPIRLLSFLCENPYSGIGTVGQNEQLQRYYADQRAVPKLLARHTTQPSTPSQATVIGARFWWAKAISQVLELIRGMLRRLTAES
jgi:hypothetical protein